MSFHQAHIFFKLNVLKTIYSFILFRYSHLKEKLYALSVVDDIICYIGN